MIEGKVTCNCRFNGKYQTADFVKRSGEFFDIKLFNLFTFPIGFDNTDFQARTIVKTRLFAWDIEGILAMRKCRSPSLVAFWEFTVLRSLSSEAVRHHLKKQDTLYDSLLIPEDGQWLDGSKSRDFLRQGKEESSWCERLHENLVLFANSLNPIPPRGVRHRPGLSQPNSKQAALEEICTGRRSRFSVFGDESHKSSQSWQESSAHPDGNRKQAMRG